MKLSAERVKPRQAVADTLALFAFEDGKTLAGGWAADRRLEKRYFDAARAEDFKGKEKTVVVFYPESAKPARRVIVAGLGKAAAFDAEKLRRASAAIANRIKALDGKDVTYGLPLDRRAAVPVREQAQAAVAR